MTFADLFNAPVEMEFLIDGKKRTFKLRRPTALETALFQRWLEQRARDAIGRATYQSEEERAEDRRLCNRDIACGEYEWGGELCIKSLRTPGGMAKVVSIILSDQGVTEEMAREMVEQKLKELAATIFGEECPDPNLRRAVRAMLGLPDETSPSPSSTHHSDTPSATSAPSPTVS